MSAADALVQAILAAPDDDTPRLVYADWLQEHAGLRGSIRAKLIRGQCELERMAFDDPGRERLVALCVLYERKCLKWLGDMPVDNIPDWNWRCAFDRGMPVYHLGVLVRADWEVELPPDLPAEFEYQIRADVGDYSTADFRAWLDLIMDSQAGARVTGLVVWGSGAGFTPADVETVSTGRFRRLRSLTLSDCGLTDADADRIAAGVGFDHLRTLVVGGNELTADGLSAIANGRLGRQLRAFSALGNPGSADADALASWLLCPELRHLHLVNDYELRFDRPASGPLRIRVVPDEIPF